MIFCQDLPLPIPSVALRESFVGLDSQTPLPLPRYPFAHQTLHRALLPDYLGYHTFFLSERFPNMHHFGNPLYMWLSQPFHHFLKPIQYFFYHFWELWIRITGEIFQYKSTYGYVMSTYHKPQYLKHLN